MIFCSILIIGIFTYSRLPLEFAPGIEHPWMWIYIPNPNASPEENNKKIAIPLEENLKQIHHVEEIEITSDPNGCSANISFKNSTDLNAAYRDVRDACERARDSFPEDAGEARIIHRKSDDWPIMWLGLGCTLNKSNLTHLIHDRIIPTLERIDGVASVKTHGTYEEQLFIDLDLNKLRKYGVDVRSIYGTLKQRDREASVGEIDVGGTLHIIRPVNMLKKEDDYRFLPLVKTNIHLKDIAHIERRLPEKDERFRINGKQGVTLSIMKESNANTVAVSDRIHAVLNELSHAPDLKGLQFLFFFDQARWIRNSLQSLKNAGLWGGVFATFILFLFLRHLGFTFVIISAVPLSILSALIGMYFLGYSLNIGTMAGLMLAIGMLVDNSVVVSENIHRLWRHEKNSEHASIKGAGEVGTAITGSTFTTIIVFLPLVFSEGEMGVWMRQIGIPITLSLLSSLFIALTLVPLAISTLIRQKPPKRQRKPFFPIRFYRIFLAKTLHARVPSALIIIALLISANYPAKRIVKSVMANRGDRQLVIVFSFPQSYTFNESDAVIRRIEKLLLNNKEKLNLKNIYVSFDRVSGHFSLFLKESGKHLLTDREVKKRIRSLMPKLPGISWEFGWRRRGATGGSQVDITIEGKSLATLSGLAEETRTVLKHVDGIIDVHENDLSSPKEIHIHIKSEQARRNGFSVKTITDAVAIALKGRPLPDFQSDDREIKVILQLKKDDRKTLQQIKNLVLYNSDGMGIPFQNLATFETVSGRGVITRYNGKIQEFIQMETDQKDMMEIRKNIKKAMDGVRFPEGYTWHFGRSFKKFDETFKNFSDSFILALLLVLFLLGSLFESFIHPFTIIFTLPLALIGVLWTQYLTDTVQDTMANIGLILLIGIVVNNAIVLVDRIIRLRAMGLNREDAVLQACTDRIRPIIMTASTTILGLFPMAAAKSSAAGALYAGLAITVIGGLFSATLLTLIALPLVYTIMDDFQNGLKNFVFSLKTAIEPGKKKSGVPH